MAKRKAKCTMRSCKSKDKQYNGQKESRLTTSHCTFGFPFGHYIACPSTYDFSLYIWLSFWPLYCLSFDLRLLIVHLAFLLAIISLVLLLTTSHCTFGFPFGHYIACPSTYDFSLYIWLSFWPLYCLSFDLRLLIAHLAFLLAIILLVLRHTTSHCTFGIFNFSYSTYFIKLYFLSCSGGLIQYYFFMNKVPLLWNVIRGSR
jgi:hypothetical protein